VIILVIEIYGYYHQVLLTGKKCPKQQLMHKYLQAKELTDEMTELPYMFCRLYNFEPIPYNSDTEVDFVIDTDTDRIYSPSY
jgi:hypothetical protein